MHALGECTIFGRHRRDAVEDRLQPVGLLGALYPPARSSVACALIAARSSAVKPPDSEVEWSLGIAGLLSGVTARHDADHLMEG